MRGSIVVVGVGPGHLAQMTPAARSALEGADVIVGYSTYLDLIEDVAPHTPRNRSGMRREVERVLWCVERAHAGLLVALVSSGDPGVYGMAGLVYDVLAERPDARVEVEVVPGVTAVCAAASLLGAPLMTDFAVISLSDQLTPRADILQRVDLAAKADFVLCLYNPKGRHRTEPFDLACEILLTHRSPHTPVGIVRSAFREEQSTTAISLAELPHAEVDMLSIVIIGSSRTRLLGDRMVTPRGYGERYSLGGEHGAG